MEEDEGVYFSSRNNPIPREDEPNLQPASLHSTTMKTALKSEVAEETPLRLTVCVGVCVREGGRERHREKEGEYDAESRKFPPVSIYL